MFWRRRSVADSHTIPTVSGQRPRRWGWRKIAIILALMFVAVAICGPSVFTWWLIRSGRLAIAAGHPRSGIEPLTRAIAAAPNSAEAHYRLAVAFRRSGELEKVDLPLRKAQQLGWPREDVERQSLLSIAQSGDVQSVDSRIKAIIARGASDEAAEEIYEALAIGYLKTYRLKDAWECLTFWNEWQPRAIFPRFWRAEICRRQNQPELEERGHREILEIDPEYVAARCRLAEMCKESNRVEEAISHYERCLKGPEVPPEAVYGLAECRHRTGDNVGAETLLTRALQMKLNSVQRAAVLSQLGQIAAEADRTEEAVRYFEEAVQLAPRDITTLFALSQACTRLGDPVKSRTWFERSQAVQELIRRMDLVTSQIAKTPADPALRYEAGSVALELGLENDAVAWFQSALQVRPTFKPALDALAAVTATIRRREAQGPEGAVRAESQSRP
jgi:tetratricopeptide (TPR) repeat protein